MKNKLLEVIKKTFELKSVSESIAQTNCDKWTSLNHINLVVEIEDEFDISLEPEEIGRMTDFNSIYHIIEAKMNH